MKPPCTPLFALALALLALVILPLGGCERTATIAQEDAGLASKDDAGPAPAGADACQPLCTDRECGPDGCGGSCGQCRGDGVCDEATYRCLCEPESALHFCARLDKECGEVTATDNCGATRTEDCGRCEAPRTCESATNRCTECEGETDAELCAANAVDCGPLTATDRCGVGRAPHCGDCRPDEQCTVGHCEAVCVPESDLTFCSRYGKACGLAEGLDNCGASRTVAECGPCAGSEFCAPEGTCTLCVPESDADLCAWYFMNCGRAALVDGCGTPRSPDCGACSGNDTCQVTRVCGTVARPTNDLCATPVRLVFDANGTATATADLTGADDTVEGNCGGSGGADVFYAFTLTAPKRVTLAIRPNNAQAHAIVSLRDDCFSASDIACRAGDGPGLPATAAVPLPIGTYYVAIDTFAGSPATTVSLSVTASDPPPAPSNDTCAGATALTFIDGVATVSGGDTFGAADDYEDICEWAQATGPEVVFSFSLAVQSAVAVRLVRDLSSVTYEPIVQLLSNCPNAGLAVSCGNGANGVATAGATALGAGTYYVVVDGANGSSGQFALEVTVSTPVLNDLCAGAVDVPLAPSAAGATDLLGAIAGDTTSASDDYTSSCHQSATGNDLVYSFTLPAGAGPKDVRVEVTPASTGSAFEGALSVRTDCATPDDIACGYSYLAGVPTWVTLTRLAPGTYFVFVDTWDMFSNGPFTLSVTASEPPPPPPNDVCGHALAVVLDPATGTGQATGSTTTALDDYSGSCAATYFPHDGGDVVYTVTLASPMSLSATVWPNTPGYRPAVYIQRACGDNATDLGCGHESAGVAHAYAVNLAAGSYTIVVDGLDATAGDFTLDVLAYPALTNDGCASPAPMAFDSTGTFVAHGDACTLRNDASASASGGCGGAGSGLDSVYRLVLAQTQNVQLSLWPGHAGDALIYVRSNCAAATTELACALGQGGVGASAAAGPELTLKRLAAGTYYVWLDNNWNCGVYTFTALLSDPPAPQSNDLCSAPETVAIDPTTLVGTTSGDTDAATGELEGGCRPGGNGPELVYDFTLTAQSSVAITVTPQAGSSLKPVVYVRTACAQAQTELGCRAESQPATAAQLTFPRLQPGTYVVVVDSYDANDSGPFDLSIATAAVGPAARNDTCANAAAMPAFDATTHLASVSGNTGDGSDDETSFCGRTQPLDGPDLAYSVTLASPARVRATVTRAATNTTYRPSISIRSNCALVDEVACVTENAAGSATVDSISLAAGTWYLVVDGLDRSFGPFTLVLEDLGTPTAGDDCANPIALAFDANGTATTSGDLGAAGIGDQYDLGCAPSTDKDMVYSFTTAADQFVTMRLASPMTSARLRPALALRAVCGDAATETGCAMSFMPGSTASFTTTRLRAGTYYVIVDSLQPGPFELTVQLASPVGAVAGNDTCAGAAAIPLDSRTGAGHATGDTGAAYDDYSSTGCSSLYDPLTGGDLVYSITLPPGATTLAAVAVHDAASPSFRPALSLRTNTCSSTSPLDEIGCSGDGMLTVSNLTGGTYYLIVDGHKGKSGGFTLDVATRSTAIGNDRCATAETLLFDASGAAVVLGDTSFGSSIAQGPGSCYSSGPELYYAVTTSGTKDLSVEVMPTGSQFSPATYIRSSCADPASARGCSYAYGATPVQLSALRLPGGTYTIVVDSIYSANAGPFILRVTATDPPPPPAHDGCAAPQVLTLPAPGSPPLRITDSTLAANDDLTSVCATADYRLDGPDVVYSFTLTAAAQVTATVTPRAGSARYVPAVYLRKNCATASNDICFYPRWGGGPANPATITASLESGTYFLIVDGVGGTAGEFDLDLSQSTQGYREADHCINAKSLDPLFVATATTPTERVATITGDNTGASNDADATCDSWSGADLVYSFTVTGESLVRVSVSPDGASSAYQPLFHVRTTCTDPSTELYCRRAPGAATARGALYRLAAGTYYVFVDGVTPGGSTDGAFTAEVRVSDMPAAPPNDACASATPLAFQPSSTGTGGAQSETASLPLERSEFASDDDSGSCAPTARGNEVVYTFTTTTARSFSATVTPEAASSPDFMPAVYLRTGCAPAAGLSEVTCATTTAGGAPVTVSANSLPAGTYYLFVDAWRASPSDPPGGTFALAAALDAPLTGPANDGCAFAQTIALSGPAPSVTTLTAQTTAGAHDDASAACGALSDGPDVVYRLVLTAAAQLTLRVTPSTGFLPAVYLRSTCGAGGGTLACAASTYGSTAVEASRAYLAPGTYFVWVDAAAALSAGSFDLEVKLSTATAIPPANDLCGPTVPALAEGVAVSGTTVNAFNDYAGIDNVACGIWGIPGPEVVYAYTPAADGPITVTLTSHGADLMVWMTETTCGEPSGCVAAADNGGPFGGSDTMTFSRGRAGVTYFIYVDSYQSANAGTFTLSVD